MEELTGRAFAPSAISNFFAIHHTGTLPGSDLRHTGATGGGYMLSSGVLTTARVVSGAKVAGLRVVVNGDPWYEAATTRTAVELLVDAAGKGSAAST